MIAELRAKVTAGQFEFSRHALDQTLKRRITVAEMRETFACGEIIEDYPQDKYGPSCLVFGMTAALRPLHVQCSHPSRPVVKIITAYDPAPAMWIDFRTRRGES